MSRLYALLALPLPATLAAGQTTCDQLKLSLPDTTVSSIQYVPAGPFVAPPAGVPDVPVAPAPATPGGRGRGAAGPGRAAQPALSVPAYCRVQMVLTPSSDSRIEASMFLPVEDWNGKLQ